MAMMFNDCNSDESNNKMAMMHNDLNSVESNVIFQWTNCCRLCLNPSAKIDLLESDMVYEDLSCKIKRHLNFLMYRGDPMPRKICGECLQQLDAWNTFRQKCNESETQLRTELLQFNSLNFVQEFLQKYQAMQEPAPSLPQSIELEPSDSGKIISTVNSDHVGKIISGPTETNLHGRIYKTSEEHAREILREIIDKIENAETGKSTTEQTHAESPLNWEPVFTVKPDNRILEKHIKVESIDFNPDIVKSESSKDPTWDAGNVSCTSDASENSNDDRRYNLRPRSNLTPYEELPDDDDACSQITPWKCDACHVHFSTRLGLSTHQTSKKCCGTTMQRFRCTLCRKRFYSLEDYAEHNIHHITIAHNFTDDDLYRCNKCDAKYADQVRFDDHVKRHNENSQSSPGSDNRQPHYVVENRISRAVAEPQQTPMVVENHQPQDKTYVDPPPTPCTPAPLKLPTVTPTLPEIKLPSDQNRFLACSLCINRFQNEDLLYDHRFAIHGIPDERVACITCAVKFRTQNLLDEHLKSHCINAVGQNGVTGISARCRQCGRFFATQEELVKHEAVKHIPLSCRQCQRPFPTRSALLLHYRTHNKTTQPVGRPSYFNSRNTEPAEEVENPKTCRYCSVEFKYKSDYDVHYAAHIKFKKNNFECDISPNSEIRFQCSECPQLFLVMIDVAQHSRDKHNGKECKLLPLKCPAKRVIKNSFLCSVCNLDFPTSEALSFHAKKKHGINEPVKPYETRVSAVAAATVNQPTPPPQPVKQRELWQEEANKIIRDISGVQCCTLCHIKLGKAEDAKRHRAVHSRGNLYVVQVDESLYQCTVCDHSDNKRDAALRHVELHANVDFKPQSRTQVQSSSLSCPFCDCRFTNASSVEDHIVDKHAAGEE